MFLLQVLLIGWTSFVRSLSLLTRFHGLSSRPAQQSVYSRSRTQSYRRNMFSGIVEVCAPVLPLLVSSISAYISFEMIYSLVSSRISE